jgi:membrane fusion protein, heavy metal efflux system
LTAFRRVSQREKEQAISDQQTADGALKAARDAVLVFGKTPAEIDQMIASRKIDPALVVRSPIAGKVTAFNAPAGLLVQPGNPPAPYSVPTFRSSGCLRTYRKRQRFHFFTWANRSAVKVMAYPDRVFQGKVSKIYETVDPNTHRVTIRSEIADPKDELRPGMLANFVIRSAIRWKPLRYREWCGPRSRRHHDGMGDNRSPPFYTKNHQDRPANRRSGSILDGLQRGELVVADGRGVS